MHEYRTRLIPATMAWLGGALLLWSAGAGAAFYAGGFSAAYEVYRNGIYLGTTHRTLKPGQDTRWVYTSVTEPKGVVSLFVSDTVKERSEFRKTDHRIRPLAYEYHQTGGEKEKHYRMEFDWDTDTLEIGNKDKTMALAANTQDLMTFQLQLMLDLQQGKRDLRYTIADRKEVREYELGAAQPVETHTPLGKFATLRVVSKKTESGNQYKLWCAESLHYLPVKVQKVENDGDTIELVIAGFKPLR